MKELLIEIDDATEVTFKFPNGEYVKARLTDWPKCDDASVKLKVRTSGRMEIHPVEEGVNLIEINSIKGK